MGTATPQELDDFQTLLRAVLGSPELVPRLIRDSPRMLEANCNSAETVLHWLAVEGDENGVKLLHSLGAKIPEFALIEAIQMGHVGMVRLLVSLGARLSRYPVERVLSNPVWNLSDEQKTQIRSLF